MITIGVLMSSTYVDDSAHMICELCSRAKERGDVNLLFFPGIAGSDRKKNDKSGSEAGYEHADSLADAFIVSGQEMLYKLLEQPGGAFFSNILEQVPYVLLKDDAGQALDQACALVRSLSDAAFGKEAQAEESEQQAEKRDTFELALEFAVDAHKGQVRKGSSIPYIVHPIETALIAMTLTRDQDIIIAALFHDIIEDTRYSEKEIEDVFGARIARLVQMESENKRKGQDASKTWKIRKQEFIDSLDGQTEAGKIIALSDKLSNMRATYQGYRKNGESFWLRFNEKRKDMHGWYYRTVADKLAEFANTDAWKELDRLIKEVFENGC